MKILTIIIVVLFITFSGFVIITMPRISVNIENSASASDIMPDGVSRFQDGVHTCYVLDKYEYGNLIGGIACAN